MKGEALHIAILGNCTTDYLERALQAECDKNRIHAVLYNGPFNQYHQEILNPDSQYHRFEPDISILWLEGAVLFPEWYDFSTLVRDKASKLSQVQEIVDAIAGLAEQIHKTSHTTILMNNFAVPYHSPLGILDGKYYPGLKDMITLLNQKLHEWSAERDDVFICDYNGLLARQGAVAAEDPKLYYLAKVPVSLPFTNIMAAEYMRYIMPHEYRNKKCLVLDLDNTLWGGVVGEDGISGIRLDIAGSGRSFYDFQREIRNLYEKGILLAINSKNNPEDALEAIEGHPHMLLRKYHFASMKINWQNKADNMVEIARDLNIGLDSLVFFDDNPVERELIRTLLPMVTVIDVPADTGRYAATLRDTVFFEMLKLTREDMKRNSMYEENRKRLEFQQRFTNQDEYLLSLETKIYLDYANAYSIPRIAQLTQKTNQFNMTTKRYSQADIEEMLQTGRYLIFSCRVADRFSDSGIVGVCCVAVENQQAVIDTYLLSCRVLGRNVEFAFLAGVVSLLREKGISRIGARFIRTEKNRANTDFYSKAGFRLDSSQEDSTQFVLDSGENVKKVDGIETIIGEGNQ